MKNGESSPRYAQFERVILSVSNSVNALPLTRVWQILVLSVIAILASTYLIHPTGVHLEPLYVVPICLACWRLGLRVGLSMAILAAILSVGVRVALAEDATLHVALANMVLQAIPLGFIAAIVSSFRLSLERERHLARRDGVTSALTRTAFEMQAKAMISAARLEKRSLLLTYLDLDGFKAINDRHGHEAGDSVLKQFAAEVRTMLRAEDCFGRMGGDEFAALISLESDDAAQSTAERLHDRFTAALAGIEYRTTCSMGALTVLPERGATLGDLIREADKLMYAAKHAGKSGVRFGVLPPPLDIELPSIANHDDNIALQTRENFS